MSEKAAYQMCKCDNNMEERRTFARISAYEAKRLGRKIAIHPKWNAVKLNVRSRMVRAKFEQHLDLACSLLETDEAKTT